MHSRNASRRSVSMIIPTTWTCATARSLGRSINSVPWNTLLSELPASPDLEDDGIDQKLEEERGDDPADQGGGDPLHHVGPGPVAPHDREQPHEDRHDGHHLWPDPLDSALLDRLLKVGFAGEAPLALSLLV